MADPEAPDEVAAAAAAALEALTEAATPAPDAPASDPLLAGRDAGLGSGVPRALERLGDLTVVLGRSARSAGVSALGSGRWLAETVVDVSGHVPVRDAATLSERHHGAAGDELADDLIRSTARASASVGAAAGALLGAQELVPLTWLTMPLELAIETALVAGLEMKLVAELQSTYGHPVAPAGSARAYTLARTWADNRGMTTARLIRGGAPGVAEVLGVGARNELIRVVRRRLLRRAGFNLTQLAPVLVGVAAGAAVNGRATRQFGDTVRSALRP